MQDTKHIEHILRDVKSN